MENTGVKNVRRTCNMGLVDLPDIQEYTMKAVDPNIIQTEKMRIPANRTKSPIMPSIVLYSIAASIIYNIKNTQFNTAH